MALETALRDVPIQLTYPWAYRPPAPTVGCDVCSALARRIADADDPHSVNYNPSKASDLRVEMKRHQAGRPGHE